MADAKIAIGWGIAAVLFAPVVVSVASAGAIVATSYTAANCTAAFFIGYATSMAAQEGKCGEYFNADEWNERARRNNEHREEVIRHMRQRNESNRISNNIAKLLNK